MNQPMQSSLPNAPVRRDRTVLDVQGSEITHEVRYLIIGAGLAGLGMALQLKASGRRDFLVLEQGSRPGGYWRDAAWPGSASDTPSQLSAFSFAPYQDWSRRYPDRRDMMAYIEQLIARYGLEPCIEYNARVISLRYLSELQRWQVELRDGRYLRAEFVMMGMGALSEPERPPVSGLDGFRGEVFHASDWPREEGLRGRHVAVVGTGEAAIQSLPEIVSRAASVTWFQKEPVWVLPRQNRGISLAEKALLQGTPWLLQRQRQRAFKRQEAQFSMVKPGSRSQHQARKRAQAHLKRFVSSIEKRRQLTPDYPIGSRPIRYSDDLYRAVSRNHVRVVNAPVREVTGHHAIGEDGSRAEIDTLVFGTPWRWPEHLVPTGMVMGPQGSDLGRRWQARGVDSYCGLCVPGMPNLFLLNGPHTALRHNSPLLMLEAQYGAILDCLSHMDKRELTHFEVRPEAAKEFARQMRSATTERVWNRPRQGHLPSQNAANDALPLWPHDVQTYQQMMTEFDRSAFVWR